VVVVATVKALKVHSEEYGADPTREELDVENVDAVAKGCCNMEKHIQNMKSFGVPVVAVVNTFPADTEAEQKVILEKAKEAGADFAVVHRVHPDGGAGGAELAEAVVQACEMPKDFEFTYPDDAPIKEKIEAIATKIYGADGVDFLPAAEKKVELYTKLGLDNLPMCMAKTHLSLSHDPVKKGVPTGWRLPIRDIRASTGAGFLFPLCGEMRTMPGLGRHPAGFDVDIDEKGQVVGLF
jgi:formate--tetrahydrofolate ligase